MGDDPLLLEAIDDENLLSGNSLQGEHIVFPFSLDDEGIRLDQVLVRHIPGQTRSFLQKLLAEGMVLVQDTPRKANYKGKAGQIVSLTIPPPRLLEVRPEDIPLDILYEDKDILVVNKPKGMVVHPAPGHESGTLVNAVLYHCKGELSGINGCLRPGIVHRIDRDTTGVLVVCKNDTAHQELARQLAVHSITRRYRAVAAGVFSSRQGMVDAPIGRHPVDRKRMAVNHVNGRRAVTHYQVLEQWNQAAYLECRLETGRTHQIRVHLSSIGHPLLGDEVYGSGKNQWHLQGQALHAMVLGFVHPSTHKYVEFTAPLPPYFDELRKSMAPAMAMKLL